jgi:hypothetical protein
MKKSTFYMFAAFVLIPILFVSMPLNFVNKIGSGCPIAKEKPVLKCNPCMYHSLTSPNASDATLAALPSGNVVLQPLALLSGVTADTAVTLFTDLALKAPPLRC